MNKYNTILILFALLFLYSCEYDKDEVYQKELTPPEEITIDINLDGLENGETLYIYRKTKVHYNADMKGKNFLKYEVKLGDEDLYLPENGILYFDPWDYRGVNELQLTINVELKTGTNSIVEHLGLEKYLGSFKYKIKFIHDADLSLKFENTITKDRNLKVSWKPLDLQQLQVAKYEVYKHNGWKEELLVTITNPADAYFIDKSHVLGKQDYLILTYFENDRIEKLWDYYTVQIEYPSDGLHSEPIGLNKMKVWWDKHSYDSYYALELEDGTIIDSKDKREVEIEHNYNFPISKGVKLHLYPVDYEGDLKQAPYSEQSLTSSYVKNIFLNGGIICNIKDKELYAKGDEKLFALDVSTMKVIPNKYIDTGYDWDWYHLFMNYSENFARLFYLTARKITIYDNNLNKISQIDTYEKEIKNYSIFQSTTSGKLITGYTENNDYKIHVYNVATNKLLYTETLNALYLNKKRSMSKNGTYLCLSEDNYIQIFSFNNIEMFNVNSVSTYPINFEECVFSKVDDEELYVVEKEQFYKMNVLTKNRTTYIKGRFIAEDPFTGNIAYIQKDNTLVILNAETNKEIYSIPVSTTWDLRLFNSILTTDKSGTLFYLDLNPYIK